MKTINIYVLFLLFFLVFDCQKPEMPLDPLIKIIKDTVTNETNVTSSVIYTSLSIIQESEYVFINNEYKIDRSGSYDGKSNYDNLLSRFDFNNDGIFDTVWSYDKIIITSNQNSGNYTIVCELKDNQNNIESISTTLKISELDLISIKTIDLSATPLYALYSTSKMILIKDGYFYGEALTASLKRIIFKYNLLDDTYNTLNVNWNETPRSYGFSYDKNFMYHGYLGMPFTDNTNLLKISLSTLTYTEKNELPYNLFWGFADSENSLFALVQGLDNNNYIKKFDRLYNEVKSTSLGAMGSIKLNIVNSSLFYISASLIIEYDLELNLINSHNLTTVPFFVNSESLYIGYFNFSFNNKLIIGNYKKDIIYHSYPITFTSSHTRIFVELPYIYLLQEGNILQIFKII